MHAGNDIVGEVGIEGQKREERSEAAEGIEAKRIRIAEYAGTGGMGVLTRQLDRWSRECIVCRLASEGGPITGQTHPIQQCRQDVAIGVGIDSKIMDRRMKRAQGKEDRVGCGQCSAPREICERWQWDETREGWVEDDGQKCQYKGVLIPGMIAMMQLGKEEGKRKVREWLHDDEVNRKEADEVFQWFSKRVRGWDGVEVQQAVVVFIMLVRTNGLLDVVL